MAPNRTGRTPLILPPLPGRQLIDRHESPEPSLSHERALYRHCLHK